eukprot:TRINITY_DN27595_c0_g1_i2.p3 TRINITY_DN27595_c0_g1~~TRINITY_DN27595_c0_g1_i2.p3  ORF type:complete len:181 (+),score=6.72 TRINITY_DN27595_c0_g1_i2:599-1141(+)
MFVEKLREVGITRKDFEEGKAKWIKLISNAASLNAIPEEDVKQLAMTALVLNQESSVEIPEYSYLQASLRFPSSFLLTGEATQELSQHSQFVYLENRNHFGYKHWRRITCIVGTPDCSSGFYGNAGKKDVNVVSLTEKQFVQSSVTCSAVAPHAVQLTDLSVAKLKYNLMEEKVRLIAQY